MSIQEPLWSDDELASTSRRPHRRRIASDYGRPASRRPNGADYDRNHRDVTNVPTGRYL